MTPKLTTVAGVGDVRRLQTQTSINASIGTVWKSLTEAGHVAKWWSTGTIGKLAGERIQLGSPEDVDGTILVKMAPHVFEFTWHDDPANSSHPEWIEPNTRGLVRFDLVATGTSSTLVTLIEFAPAPDAHGAAAGWHHIFEQLKMYAETGSTASSTEDRYETLKQLYAE